MNRRKFLSIATVSTAIPVLTLIADSTALAADLPMVDAESAQAKALKYETVSQTDGKSCDACSLYQGSADSQSGACPLFAGSNVSAKAVCSAWTAKT